MSFSNELNNYMDLLNCSAKELCKESGLSPTLISRYLNNKRTPKPNSEYLEKIVDALYQISINKNINLSKDSINQSLTNTLILNAIDYNTFVSNFNSLQDELKISNIEMAKALGYDASFLSRIKSKERRPADLSDFINKLTNYIVSSHSNGKKEILASLLNCSIDDLNNTDDYKYRFSKWITSTHTDNNQNVFTFLSKLDSFNLNDYIGTDFNKVKVPTSPVIFKSSKTFFGIDGRKQAEGEFLKTTLLSKSKEPIFFYSNLPMTEAAEDEEFKKKWILAITMVLKKGLHLNMIHNIDRPINEMLVGLESWIPIYMTGSISPYYFKTPPSNLFLGSHCTSGSVALSSECIKYNENNSRFYLTTKKDEVQFEKEKSKYMLSKAKPLMKIFREKDKESFKEFMNKEENKNIQKVEKDTFKNIDFSINPNQWVMINKKTSPEIHFVIYNEKLMNAIKVFLTEK